MKNVIYWAVVAGIAAMVISQYDWSMWPVLCFMWWVVGQMIKDQYEDDVFWKKLNK